MRLASDELELIDRLVRRDRTAVSTALLAIAGIGAGEASRRAVLSRIAEAACWAQAEGAISARRPSRSTDISDGRSTEGRQAVAA